MKDSKKNTAISKVNGLDKRINKAKSQLSTLEERRETIMTESIMEEMRERNMDLNDFFKAVERESKEKAAQAAKPDTTSGGTGANAAFSHNKTENNYTTGGKTE